MGACREGYYEGEGRDLQGGLSMERMGPARRAARRVTMERKGDMKSGLLWRGRKPAGRFTTNEQLGGYMLSLQGEAIQI